MKIKASIIAGLLSGIFFASTVTASAPIHRQGCEFPLKGVEVCWEATSSMGAEYGTYPELHLLPLTRMIAGQEQVLVDTTRKIYRQLLPSGLAERLIPEWKPVFYLEDAVMSGQEWGWPAYMWIAPRAMRNSSAMSSGLVDWDVYFFADNRLTRTLRIRVESKPKLSDNSTEIMAASSAAMFAGAIIAPVTSSAVSLGAGSMAVANPPEAGRSLELMTELATRQILHLAQFSISDMKSAEQPKESFQENITNRFNNWKSKIFAPK